MNVLSDTMVKFGYPETLIKEYAHWCVLLRKEQTTLGSLILISKEQKTCFSDISSDGFAEFRNIVKDIESVLSKLFQYDKINYLMLMMIDPDVHFHVIPRYSKTLEFNNIEFNDYGWSGLPELSQINIIDKESFTKLKERIRNNINY